MGKIGTLTAFTSGTTAKAAEVNGNFDEIKTKANTYGMWVDEACTVSASHTFSASQTFSAGLALTGTLTMATAASKLVPGATSFTVRNNADSADNLKVLDSGATTLRNTLTVSSGGVTVTGNSTITGTLGGLTGLTVASGGVAVTGNSSVAGTLAVTTGKTTLAATAAGYASLNLPHGTAPSSPANGDLWTTTGGLYARVNGSTQGPFGTMPTLLERSVRSAGTSYAPGWTDVSFGSSSLFGSNNAMIDLTVSGVNFNLVSSKAVMTLRVKVRVYSGVQAGQWGLALYDVTNSRYFDDLVFPYVTVDASAPTEVYAHFTFVVSGATTSQVKVRFYNPRTTGNASAEVECHATQLYF